MGYAKYFEDNLEMVLERTEGMPRVSGQANMYRTSGWNARAYAAQARTENMPRYSARAVPHRAPERTGKPQPAPAANGAGTGRGEPGKALETTAEKKVYRDMLRPCCGCGRAFLFSAASQKRFEEKRWDPPKRCRRCRSLRQMECLMSMAG